MFASLDTIVQLLVIITQLSLTGFIATRLGVIVLLVTIPFVMVFGLTVYAAFGTFSVMAAAMVLRRWGEYAFIRPGREMLFSKVDKESKYKAKNVCDVAVYRIADAGFAQIKKFLDAVGMGGTAQAMTAAAVAALWAINGWWLGRRFEKEKPPAERSTGVGIGRVAHRTSCRCMIGRETPGSPRRRSIMPSSVIRSLSLRPGRAAPRPGVRLGPALSLSRGARGNLRRDAPRIFQGRILQRVHPRPVSPHARELTWCARTDHLRPSAACSRSCRRDSNSARNSSNRQRRRDLSRRSRACLSDPSNFRAGPGNRETVSFGWRYDFNQAQITPAPPIPDFLLPLRERAAGLAGIGSREFEQALVIRYGVGAGIGWHRDRPVFDKVFGLSLLSPCMLRFRRRRATDFERFALGAPSRSAYLLTGEIRHEWEHSIAPMEVMRYSITFRSRSPA